MRNLRYVRRKALMKITNSRAVHTVHIGHKTNGILENYTVGERNGTAHPM
jgi:hypothetical protein